LFISLVVIQLFMGMLIPLAMIALIKILKSPPDLKKMVYFISAILVQVGIFSTRWNIVIGGQLFSKSFRGLTVYKITFFGLEGFFASVIVFCLPFVLLYILTKILPPWEFVMK